MHFLYSLVENICYGYPGGKSNLFRQPKKFYNINPRWHLLGLNLAVMAAETVLFVAANFLMEYKAWAAVRR